MKRLRRLFLLFSVFVCLFALGSNTLIVSAVSGEVYWNPTYVRLPSSAPVSVCTNSSGSRFIPPDSYSFIQNPSSPSGLLTINEADGIKKWQANFVPTDKFPSYATDRYMQLDFEITVFQTVSMNYYPQDPIGAFYISSNSRTYEFPITQITETDPENNVMRYLLRFSGVADVGEGFNLKDQTFTFNCTGFTNSASVELMFGSIDFSFHESYTSDTVKIVESVEQGFADLESSLDQNTQDIMDNQNQNTQDIINNQNQNSQDIINNQDSNTQDIIDNENQNTQDIIDNENANAGKTHGFLQNIKDAITNLINQIVALPGKIWEVIENGLKNLFIPDQEYIVGYKSKWETLLSSRFGAVYESFEILIDFAESITEADQTNTVSIPCVSIPMPDNNEFVFGPYDVKVVPDATVLNFLVDTCKMITAVVAVFLLVNALRRRWEEIMNAD